MVDLPRLTAGGLGCLLIVAYQLQLLPFFSRLFVDDRTVWPVIYYGCWMLIVGTTLLLCLQRSILLRASPVLAVCALSAALTFIHPIDAVAKNFLVGAVFVACGTVLAIASAPLALLRFSGMATILSAVICLLDIFYRHGFTNTPGRAAGLGINANVAAAGLFLGAASSFWAVPHRLRTSFLLISGAAILVTLSRSTLVGAIVVGAGVVVDLAWTRLKSAKPRRPPQWISASALSLCLAIWIVVALLTNDRFSIAAQLSFGRIGTAVSTFETARDAIASQAVRSRTASAGSASRPGNATQPGIAARPGASESAARTGSSEEMIRETAYWAENLGQINSISARGILMERAFLSYREGPLMGQGFAVAHGLQPHNMFLLFAIALGPIGWLVPLAFLGLTAYWVRSVQQLPLFLATFFVMMTSHDVLFAPGMLAPIMFGIAAMNWQRHPLDGAPHTLPALPYAALGATLAFAFGSIVVVALEPTVFPFVPRSLLFFVCCAFALWSACIWRWRGKLIHQTDGTARDV
jgi:hypothetical protein